jgi:hypothetical protein
MGGFALCCRILQASTERANLRVTVSARVPVAQLAGPVGFEVAAVDGAIGDGCSSTEGTSDLVLCLISG